MEKDCCNIKFKETDKGFCIEFSGEKIKETLKTMMENCSCEGSSWQEFFKNCCPSTPSKS